MRPEQVLDADDVEAAVEKSLRILNAAGQTRSGLSHKLKQAGFAVGAIDAACDRVEALGYVNDRAYAEGVLRRRHRQGRGLRVIASELHQKGIDSDLVEELIGQLSPEAEIDRATELARQLMRRHAGPRQHERVTGALLRRGYFPSVARKALEKASE